MTIVRGVGGASLRAKAGVLCVGGTGTGDGKDGPPNGVTSRHDVIVRARGQPASEGVRTDLCEPVVSSWVVGHAHPAPTACWRHSLSRAANQHAAHRSGDHQGIHGATGTAATVTVRVEMRIFLRSLGLGPLNTMSVTPRDT